MHAYKKITKHFLINIHHKAYILNSYTVYFLALYLIYRDRIHGKLADMHCNF